jgi:hypothetical protein
MSEAELVRRLESLVRAAREEVTLYRHMYAGLGEVESLESFAHLPIITNTKLVTERLEDTLTDLSHICITRTFGDDADGCGYMPRLLNYDDVLREFEVLAFITDYAELKGKHRVMLIGDERHVYTAAEFGKYMAFYGWPLSMFIHREQNTDALRTHLARFKPTAVFVDTESELPVELLPKSVKLLFTFNKPDLHGGPQQEGARAYASFDLYRDPWVGLTAIKSEKDERYTFNPQHYYFEQAADGTLVVTSFVNRLQPVIRYTLPHRGALTGADTFALRPEHV